MCQLPKRQVKQLRRNMQLIFQDPYASLKHDVAPDRGRPLLVNGVASGRSWKRRLANCYVVGLRPEYMSRHPHAFSGGQRQRIDCPHWRFAHSSLCAMSRFRLDVSVQAQVLNLLQDLRQFQLTYLFISHT